MRVVPVSFLRPLLIEVMPSMFKHLASEALEGRVLIDHAVSALLCLPPCEFGTLLSQEGFALSAVRCRCLEAPSPIMSQGWPQVTEQVCLAGDEHGDVWQPGHAAVRLPHANAIHGAPPTWAAGHDDGPAHAGRDALLPWLPASGLPPCIAVMRKDDSHHHLKSI